MSGGALGWLACPVCGEGLARDGAALRCAAGHSFDIARQGYVNLLRRAAPENADTPEMLAARDRFLVAGHYAPIAAAVAEACRGAGRIVEVGAGTGYYLNAALDAAPDAEGLATDVSPAAARRAARCHPRAAAVVADTWQRLPLPDGAVDLVLCVFAPRNPAEFARVLRPGGRAVIVVPGPGHLRELREGYGLLGVGEDKAERVRESFEGWGFEQERLSYRIELSTAGVADAIAMGPNAFHGLPASTEPCGVTVDVAVLTLRPAVA